MLRASSIGIETGDTVMDMIAAGGWFTEVLSAAVGRRTPRTTIRRVCSTLRSAARQISS
jgi:predicted methyltransferase